MTSNYMYTNVHQNEMTINQLTGNNIRPHLVRGPLANPNVNQNTNPNVNSLSSAPQPMQQPAKEQILRTPLSLLNEVCSKAKTVPQFEIAEDGPVHNRVYECHIRVEKQGFCWEARANGRTKKDAKQEAAKALLLDMDKQVEKLLVPPVPKETPSAGPVIECDPEVSGNPVGELNELCLSIKRMPAEYENISEVGKPHERVYTVACRLGSKLVECGRGRSKKHAKRASAYAMLQRVRELLKQESPTNAIPDDDDNIVEKIESLVLGKKQRKNAAIRLADIASAFRCKSGNKLESLQDKAVISTGDAVKLLREIAEEQNFKFEFMDVEKQSENNEFHVLICLYMETMIILFGTGLSKTQAKKKAAEEALNYLRILTVK